MTSNKGYYPPNPFHTKLQYFHCAQTLNHVTVDIKDEILKLDISVYAGQFFFQFISTLKRPTFLRISEYIDVK